MSMGFTVSHRLATEQKGALTYFGVSSPSFGSSILILSVRVIPELRAQEERVSAREKEVQVVGSACDIPLP